VSRQGSETALAWYWPPTVHTFICPVTPALPATSEKIIELLAVAQKNGALTLVSVKKKGGGCARKENRPQLVLSSQSVSESQPASVLDSSQMSELRDGRKAINIQASVRVLEAGGALSHQTIWQSHSQNQTSHGHVRLWAQFGSERLA
jgi:hypothetical protein